MKFLIDDLPVRWAHCISLLTALFQWHLDRLPLRSHLSWYHQCCMSKNVMLIRSLEQYAYMCDLKRTLDAAVCHLLFIKACR